MDNPVITYIIQSFGNKSYVDQIQNIAALVNNNKMLFDKYQTVLINMYTHLAHNLKEEKKSYQGVFSLLLDNYKIPYGRVLDILRKVYPEEAPVNYGVAAAAGAPVGAPLSAPVGAPLSAPVGVAAGAGGAPVGLPLAAPPGVAAGAMAAEESENDLAAAAAALKTIAENNARNTASKLFAFKSNKGGKRHRSKRRKSARRRSRRN